MMMKDWIEKLHGFLTINDRSILKELAEKKFEKYKQIEARQDVDFDEVALKAIEGAKSRRISSKNRKKSL